MYRNILEVQMKEFNAIYKDTNKKCPFLSIRDKQTHSFITMLKNRGLKENDFNPLAWNPVKDSLKFQYQVETAILFTEIFEGGITRYYIRDESLFDFFKNTEVKPKELESVLQSDLFIDNGFSIGGVVGKEQAYTIVVQDLLQGSEKLHIVSILTNDMNYTFCIEQFNAKKDREKAWVFNLAMNFLFYINAFPECVVDGVPNGVKKNPKARVLSTSDKIISHKTVEHGFVRPHFRSGYFRHLNSDWYKNCKGQVRFIASTMVKGKAKTVIQKGGIYETAN